MIIIPQNQLIQLLQHKLHIIIMYWEIIFSNIAL